VEEVTTLGDLALGYLSHLKVAALPSAVGLAGKVLSVDSM
jgi:hypothetical protein